MSNDWFIKINNTEHGPFTSERLKQLAQQGKVTPETLLKSGVAGHWLPARHLNGLFPETDSRIAQATTTLSPNRSVIKPSMPRNITPPLPSEQMEDMAADWLGTVPEDVPAPTPKQAEMTHVAFDGPVAPSRWSPVAESPLVRVALAESVAPRSPTTKPCPFCGEAVLVVAKKCKHCGEFLDQGSKSGKLSETAGSEKRILPLLLLFLPLGVVGTHAFHAGRIVRGCIYICLVLLIGSLTSFVSSADHYQRPTALFLLSIVMLLQGIFMIFDYVQIVTGAYKDSKGQPITKWV